MNQPFPSTKQLREMYKDVFSNEAVIGISCWTATNHSDVTDEAAYLAKALDTGAELFSNIKKATESIG